jgi:long-chain acyl-CoA synthetase
MWRPGDNGRPVAFSHRQLGAGAAMMRAWLTDAVEGDETWLLLADLDRPLGLVAGLGVVPLLRARLVLLGRWTADDALDGLHYLRPSYVVTDAAGAERLATAPGLPHVDLRQLRACLVSGPVPEAVADAFLDASGRALCVGYGAGEAAGLVTCPPVNGVARPSGLGLPLPGVEARVVVANGRRAGPYETGVLELAAPNGPEGWWRTGLRVKMDPAGQLHLAG